ncbi:MAG: hypothetical protein JO222_11270, partial [Frankiales bacterium]|nr:hypothetical protein [Frankiales bacterium]
ARKPRWHPDATTTLVHGRYKAAGLDLYLATGDGRGHFVGIALERPGDHRQAIVEVVGGDVRRLPWCPKPPTSQQCPDGPAI